MPSFRRSLALVPAVLLAASLHAAGLAGSPAALAVRAPSGDHGLDGPQGPAACQVFTDKVARPTQVTLGQTVEIVLTIETDCPDVAGDGRPSDIVLLIDRTSSMGDNGRFGPAIAAAEGFLGLIDFSAHQVGIVSFSNSQATVEHPLSGEGDAVRDALRAVPPPPAFDLWTDLIAALEGAGDMLASPEARPDAQPVVVLLSDGGHNALRAGSPIDEAQALKDGGALIVSIGLGVSGASRRTLEAIASRPELYFDAPNAGDLDAAYRAVAGSIAAPGALSELVVTDLLPAAVELVDGSVSPPADSFENGTLVWNLPRVEASGWRASYLVRPLVTGRYATNKLAYVDYLDADGTAATRDFPIPTITVRDPDERIRTYLPAVLNGYCAPARPFDVILALDASTSMAGDKAARSLEAARGFVALLPMPPVRAGVVAFNETASLVRPLTVDTAAVLRALGDLPMSEGTRIDEAIEAAVAALADPGGDPADLRVLVLLTDGQHAGSPSQDALDAAAGARRAGVTVYTIGIGPDADESLLVRIAGDPDRYFASEAGADLREIYRRIAGTLPCGG